MTKVTSEKTWFQTKFLLETKHIKIYVLNKKYKLIREIDNFTIIMQDFNILHLINRLGRRSTWKQNI